MLDFNWGVFWAMLAALVTAGILKIIGEILFGAVASRV